MIYQLLFRKNNNRKQIYDDQVKVFLFHSNIIYLNFIPIDYSYGWLNILYLKYNNKL